MFIGIRKRMRTDLCIHEYMTSTSNHVRMKNVSHLHSNAFKSVQTKNIFGLVENFNKKKKNIDQIFMSKILDKNRQICNLEFFTQVWLKTVKIFQIKSPLSPLSPNTHTKIGVI